MNTIPLFLHVFGLSGFLVLGAQAEVRDWTRASDGRTISAEFTGMKDESTAKLKMGNGQVYEVPVTSLSPDDQAHIKELAARKPEAGTASPGASSPGTPTGPVPEGETTVTLSGVHMCCGDCEDAVAKIGSDEKNSIPAGVTLTGSRKEGTIVVKASSGKDAQAALRAVFAAGFYGSSDLPAVSIPALKPDDFTADTMVVREPHLCCGGCVRAFTKAVESVEGVESCEAKSGATRVAVKGKGFKPYEVMMALREAGFGGSFQ